MIKNYDKIQDIEYMADDIFLHFTGNVFGIGCSAFNKIAIEKISKLKQRPDNKGFIVLFSSVQQAINFGVRTLKDNYRINLLVNQYSPGNVTFILDTENKDFNNVWIDNRIAFRIPSSKYLRDYIDKIGHPIVSTSINISGQDICNDYKTLSSDYNNWFDYSIYQPNEEKYDSTPSTIINFLFDCNSNHFNLKCLREGNTAFKDILKSWDNPVIQFVCIGNICRSPLAELYAKKRFKEEELIFQAESCGLLDEIAPISSHSKTILLNNNIPVSIKLSRQITHNIINNSSLIITMTQRVKERILEKYPDIIHRVFTFAEFTNNKQDIDDPYGLDYHAYEKAWQMIKQYTEDMMYILKGKL